MGKAKLPSLFSIEEFNNFKAVRDFPAESITEDLQKVVRSLDEREELEPFIRSILFDTNATPHGPAELVDILTHKVSVKRNEGLAAFILKGKSFPKVRPKDVSHQIYRLEKIDGLRFAVFGATGVVLDEAKEQFTSTAIRLGLDYSFLDTIDLARLFVAHGFFCPRDARRISAGRCKCGYSPKKRIFNLLQIETFKALDDAHAIGQTAGLVVLPPGSGKTRIACEDAKKVGAKRILYVAHTYEILDVAKSEFEAVFGKKDVKLHDSRESLSKSKQVSIATIQLVQRNLDKIQPKTIDYLVVDEFHHAAAKSYRRLMENAQPDFLLGLTATPFRGDRQDILELCGNNIFVKFELRTGIDSGILSPYHYFGCFDDIDYSQIKHYGNRYDIRDLERALIIPKRDKAVIKMWLKHAEGKPTLSFCCSHRHAYRVSNSFNEKGIPSEVYLADTSLQKRNRLVNKLKDGDLNVLCVVDVLNEGADLPFIECLLFLRPTESQRIFYQQLGRGLRRYVGKSHCVVIDFIGNFKNAYKIVEYQGLLPGIDEETFISFGNIKNAKQILNLPLGCEVHFDDRVIDIFAQQSLRPEYATRYNIGRILLYLYYKLARRIGHMPSPREIDRNLLLDSRLYKLVFGSWKNFYKLLTEHQIVRQN